MTADRRAKLILLLCGALLGAAAAILVMLAVKGISTPWLIAANILTLCAVGIHLTYQWREWGKRIEREKQGDS